MSEHYESKKNYHYERRHRSIFFPLLLVIIGAFFLLSNMGMIGDNAWSILVRFWPLLFILGAIDDVINAKWVGAVFNLGIGSILMLANLGYFPWTSWEMIFRLWPVLIIALGLEIVFRNQSILGSLIGIGITVFIVGGFVWFALQGPLVNEGQMTEVRQMVEAIDEAEVRIQPAVADLQIEPSDRKGQLVSGMVSIAKQEDLTEDYFAQNKIGHYTLSSEGVVIFPSKNSQSGFVWDLDLNEEIAIELTVDQAVGQQLIDLRSMNITDFSNSLAFGQMEIYLPDNEDMNGDLECVIGEMIVWVPDDLSVEFILDTGMTNVDYPRGFIREGDVLYSPVAEDGADSTIYVNMPMGSVEFRMID